MQLLEQSLRDNGVVVPTTHNNKGLRDITYAAGTGAVDVWGEIKHFLLPSSSSISKASTVTLEAAAPGRGAQL